MTRRMKVVAGVWAALVILAGGLTVALRGEWPVAPADPCAVPTGATISSNQSALVKCDHTP